MYIKEETFYYLHCLSLKNILIPVYRIVAGFLFICTFVSKFIMKFFLLSLLLVINFSLFAQQVRYVYYFDGDMNPTDKDKSVVIGRGVKQKNGIDVGFFLSKNNQHLFTASFTDSTLNVLNGNRIDFYPDGSFKQRSAYKMNVLDGLTQKWNEAGNETDSVIFRNGDTVFVAHNVYANNIFLISKHEEDRLSHTLKESWYAPDGNLDNVASFTGEKGTSTKYNKDGSVERIDSLFTSKYTNAAFPGGQKAWRNYLERNLRPETPITKGAAPGIYMVVIEFKVNLDGALSDIKPVTKLGYGMEEEAIRVVKSSGKWIPATRYGKTVTAYIKQPVNFQVIDQRNMRL